jgi:HK97 family phage portal protein
VLRNLFRRFWYGSYTTLLGDASSMPYVTAHNALRYSPVYRAVSLIANDAARIPMSVSDPTADTMLRNPSRYVTGFDFRRALTMQMLLWGNAFAAINRTRGGDLLELIVLEPDSVSLDTTGDAPVYHTSAYGRLPAEMVFHLRAPSLTGLWGESPIHLCRTSIQIMAAQEQMTLQAYENAGNPKIALVHPGRLSPEAMQRIESEYLKRHSGSQNAGRPLVLAEGIKLERISSTLDDTGLDSAKRYSIADVSRIYGVPPHMLGDTAAGNAYGSMEWMGRNYVDSCLSQWIEAWRAEIVSKLAPFSDVVFDFDQMIRPGMAETMAALRTGVEAGFLTRNEAREWIDLEPIDGLDEPTLALNMGAGGGATNIGNDTSMNAGVAE